MQRHDKTGETAKTPEPSPALAELFALLETSENVPLEHFFDRVTPQKGQKR